MSTPAESSARNGAPSASTESLPTTLPAGTVVAERYRIDSLLGEGGMGKVYAAQHVQIQKQVAIKVLHQEMSTIPEYVARFEREAVAAARISHPNVAAATDFGRLPNGSFFLVLEYVAGTDLRTILAGGPLSKERAVRITRQIASAMDAAHALGIVHRDLKPENVMVVDIGGDADFVKVLDFGIAKLDAFGAEASAGSSEQPALTKMGAIFGTPDYMSPEQALGQAVDARSDLYTLGVIFRELLSGERLFKGGAVTLMRSHVLEEAPPLPPEIARAIGPGLEGIIQRLLQKAPGARFQSSAELIAALDAAMAEDALDPPSKARSLPSIPRVRETEATKISSAALPRSTSYESTEEGLPKKRRGPGLTLLMLVLAGGGFLYFFSTPGLVGSFLSDISQASSALSATPSPVLGSPRAESVPPRQEPSASGPTSAEAPETSAAPAFTTEPQASPVVAPSDSVAIQDEPPPLPAVPPDAAPVSSVDGAAAAAHSSATHVPPPKPASKPVHKPNKPPPSAKHPG